MLLTRVGDFYECYEEDAETVSAITGLVVIKSAIISENALKISGFSCHNLETYLPKIIRAGHKVALKDSDTDFMCNTTYVFDRKQVDFIEAIH